MLDISVFGAHADDKNDTVPAVMAALEKCRASGTKCITFPKGRYDFFPDHARESYLFISNNDEGLRRIAFPLEGLKELEIDGQGSEFIFHGLIIPFLVSGAQHITLKNVHIDWEQTFHAEGIVVSADETAVELQIPEQFPYKVVNGRFQHLGEGKEDWVLRNMLEFDAVKRETAWQAQDNYDAGNRFHVEETGPRHIRLKGRYSSPHPKPGNIVALLDGRRLCPAVFITDSEKVGLENVTIYHAGAMGVIAQRSGDLTLDHVSVKTRHGSGRMVSATADATHFVSCYGRISMTDCLFENQADDAANVHAIYTRVTALPDSHRVEVRLMHGQQVGAHPAKPGHTLQFVKDDTLLPYYAAKVTRVRPVNRDYTVLTFDKALPKTVALNDGVLDLNLQPTETILRRCTLGKNRARGFLISVLGRVLIEDCNFHTPGAAILITGDANYWFESGPVQDVTIRNNRFIDCNYGVWGNAAIEINPEIKPENRREPRYHRNIHIENNRFELFFPRVLRAHSVDGLWFTENTVVSSTRYPAKQPDVTPFDIHDCSNVHMNGSESSK